MAMAAQRNPIQKPPTTCPSECWRRIIRLVPTMPPMINIRQSHHTGLNPKYSEKANSAPAIPPIPAV